MRLTKKWLKNLREVGPIGQTAADIIIERGNQIAALNKRLADPERQVREQQAVIDRLKRRIHELQTFEKVS